MKISKEQIRKMQEGRKNSKVENNLLKKFFDNPTPGRAIKAMCFQCMGGTINRLPDPNWKEAIRNCPSNGIDAAECPLYRYRPYKTKEE